MQDLKKCGKTLHFNLSGLACAACVAAVTKAVENLSGVDKADVSLMKQYMTVYVKAGSELGTDEIIRTVRELGYGAENDFSKDGESTDGSDRDKNNNPVIQNAERRKKQSEDEYKSIKRRFLISLIFTLPLFYMAMGPMVGLPLPIFLEKTESGLLFAFIQFALSLLVIFANFVIFKNGYKSLFKANPNMDTLVALGSSSAFVYSTAVFALMLGSAYSESLEKLFMMSRHLYFESSGVILTLVSLGRMLENRAKIRTGSAIDGLLRLIPDEAVVEREGKAQAINSSEIIKGDIVLLKPGERVAVDGVVVSGRSSLDTSAITGESIAREKKPGDFICQGMVNQRGSLKYRAEKVGSETTVSRMAAFVDEAAASKAPISKTADLVCSYFVPVVIGIAVLSFTIHLIVGASLGSALDFAVAVLLISCPCALGLATPVAVTAGMGAAASNGILCRSGEALEMAGRADTVVFDKTGTLSLGKPEVFTVIGKAADEDSIKKDFIKLAEAEKLSEHPLSQAVIEASEMLEVNSDSCNETASSAVDFVSHSGLGIEAVIGGEKIFAGSKKFILSEVSEIGAEWRDAEKAELSEGRSLIYASVGGQLRLIVSVADRIKDGAAEAVKKLKLMGMKTFMLTGDIEEASLPVAEKLGINEMKSGLLPEDKLNFVKSLKEDGHIVMMAGDGINDAPALSAADVSVAMGEGTDIAAESSDIILRTGDIRAVVNAVSLSRKVLRNIKENLFWAFIYNFISMPIAAGVFSSSGIRLSPMIAAAAMGLSSVFVVMNALRLKLFKAPMNVKGEENPCPGESSNRISWKNLG